MPKKPRPLPDQQYLRECLEYDPETGILTWRERPLHHFRSQRLADEWNGRQAGKTAGGIAKRKRTTYRSIALDCHRLLQHRVIWKWVTGDDPIEVDHWDCDGVNNRWRNLRHATQSENARNARIVTPRPWPKGVSLSATSSPRWFARIVKNRQTYSLGSFATPEEAGRAYAEAAVRLHGEFARF